MISLNITGENATEFEQQIRGFMALMAGAGATANTMTVRGEEKPAATTRKGKAAQPADAPSTAVATSSTASDAEGATTEVNPTSRQVAETPSVASSTGQAGTVEDPTASPSDAGPHTLDSVKARALKYSQSAGPGPLGEMLKLAGSPNGRFSEIEGNQAAIDAVAGALAGAGF